jgi:hypothetical protein
VRNEYQQSKHEINELKSDTEQDKTHETKQDTEPERRISEDQDQEDRKRKFSNHEDPIKNLTPRTTLRIDETSKETRISSIIRLSKDLRPLGKVVAVLDSPVRESKLNITLKLIDDELKTPTLLQKLNKRLQSS